MTTSPIAQTAGAARQRLASSLAALQQDPNLPGPILEIVSGLARAMGPLFQVERGTGDPSLLFTARTVLQETLARMQTADQGYPGVSDATAAIAQSLGMLFAAIREHNIVERPSATPASMPPSAAPVAPAVAPSAPPQSLPASAIQSVAPPAAQPPAAPPAPLVQHPVPLVQPAAAPVPLVQRAEAPLPLVQPAASASAPVISVPMPSRASETAYKDQIPSLIPETAAKVPVGPNGLPRLEVELDVHSDSNFFTNFLGDIRDHGGIFVATFGALHMNTPCEVIISFPGSLTADVRGVVKWKREANGETGQSPGLGIEITQASPDAWKLIDRFIKNREPIIHDV